jgi:predicted RNA binding protein YcfA (HicA-like mRNA interferase family)
MKSYSSREVIKKLEADGWYLDRVSGSHYCFKHYKKAGLVTIPHPRRNLPVKTLLSIQKQSGVKFD